MSSTTYEQAGVNRETAEAAKHSIKEIVGGTFSDRVLRGIGLFSGFYALEVGAYHQPVLVSSIDGVGTKIRIAQLMQKYDSIGIDLVHHCINDIMVSGADPLFFMDYIAADRLSVEVVEALIRGMAQACSEAHCSLISGETAEMPGVYAKDSLDLAGAIVGVVEKNAIIDGSAIATGDVMIGVASNGLHTNGYSLARKVLFDDKKYDCSDHVADLGTSLGEALLQPHLSYQKVIEIVRAMAGLRGIAHVTGGGIEDNVSRLISEQLGPAVDWQAWERPPIFHLLQREGNVSESEMRRVFNLGIGLVVICKAETVEDVLDACRSVRLQAFLIGEIVTQPARGKL